MRKSTLFLLLFLCISTLKAGNSLSDFKLKDANNKYTKYSSLKGEKLTIIDFWATWCKPCIQAVPKLNKIYKTYKDRGVALIGINTDSPRNSAKVKGFIKTYRMAYPVLRDPNSEVAKMFDVSGYPTLLILDEKDNVVFTHVGFRPGDEKKIEKEIEKLLNAKN